MSASPMGLGATDLQSAYNIPTSGSSNATIAIVDAQDDPNAESDLAKYRQQYGLPPCTTANGCFKKVNQQGQQSNYPSPDNGWAMEISLDLDLASAACPSCKILLVEANTASMADLGAAENTAVSLGATVISNSWGGAEDASIAGTDAQYFNHPGVAIFVSSGDNGYGAEYPATSQYVTAVGGTKLAKSKSSSRGWVEGAWGNASASNGGTGSGCSAYIPKPAWESDTGCKNRMEADVSAVADPSTGPAIYDTYGGLLAGATGWLVVGGTSASSPLVAGIYAATGHGGESGGFSYAHASAFYDVTVGANGKCTGQASYFCNAGPGYDGPTGNGTPNGTALAAIAGSTGGGTDGGVTGHVSAVAFQVDNATTFWGQNVYVVGDVPELGGWDPTKAVKLSPTSYPSWSGTINLTQGESASFKFIKIDGSGNVTWENGNNRQLIVPALATGQYSGTWQQ